MVKGLLSCYAAENTRFVAYHYPNEADTGGSQTVIGYQPMILEDVAREQSGSSRSLLRF
jgi:hypothetical protein